jgi:hypothetical protein
LVLGNFLGGKIMTQDLGGKDWYVTEGTLQHSLMAAQNYDIALDDFAQIKLEPACAASTTSFVSNDELTAQHALLAQAAPATPSLTRDGIAAVGLSPPQLEGGEPDLVVL